MPKKKKITIAKLPDATFSEVLGLLEVIHDHGGTADSSALSKELQIELGKLLEVIKMGELLDLLTTPGSDVKIKLKGKKLLKLEYNEKRNQLIQTIQKLPLMNWSIKYLQEQDGRTPKNSFIESLQKVVEGNPDEIFEDLIKWGRLVELVGYNPDREEIYLDKLPVAGENITEAKE